MAYLYVFLFALIFITSGIINLNPKLRVWAINYNNQMRGIKTEITEKTHKTYFYFGLFSLIIGICILIFAILFSLKICTLITPFYWCPK